MTMFEILLIGAWDIATYSTAAILATGPAFVVCKLTLLPKTSGAEIARGGY